MTPPPDVPAYLAFGDLGVDSLAMVEHLPRTDEKVWVEPVDHPGGMMGNAVVTVASLGVRAGVVALLGDDARGEFVLADLADRGVDTRWVRRIEAPTFWTLALTTPSGERCLIQFPTPAFTADWEGYDRAIVPHARWIHTTAEQGEPVRGLLRAARAAGVTTSLDVEHPFVEREDLPSLLADTDVVFFNRAAAETLGGVEAATRFASSHGTRTALVTLGGDGCALLAGDGSFHTIGAHRVDPVDTNGAGDAFAGAFAAGRLRGFDDLEGAQLANLVAALSTTEVGGHGAQYPPDRLRSEAEVAGYAWGERWP
jgi:sugar/nucleoside kinase (ribokinase family)